MMDDGTLVTISFMAISFFLVAAHWIFKEFDKYYDEE